MDTSKHFFQLHGVNAAEKVVLRKKLRRKEMVAFFEAFAPTVIGIEACGASHHWARFATAKRITPKAPDQFARGAVAICVGIDFGAISSVTILPHHAARSMI
jgi:hypothetical protein